MNDRSLIITFGVILYLITGLGYSIGTVPVTRYLVRNRSLPAFWGTQVPNARPARGAPLPESAVL